ncbi:MAG TPA: Mut7-C RNAse domain-containing protein [Myxococcaceae bacterium]|nr:Mut7-C RNAse domain-containing protein [Myxococcaceae bacterium]
MSRATVRFYAELNDLVATERRFRDSEVEFAGSPAVKDVIESLGVPHCEIDLLLVNGSSAGFGERLRDGDRVAVYPMFEAFDVAALASVRTASLREPRFVLDGHLGRLAAYLRMLGFDALWDQQPSDADLARISANERRILLTRDRGLLKRNQVTHGLLVRATHPEQQLREVVERLHLQRLAGPFTRCLRCNGALERVQLAAVEGELPPKVRARIEEVRRCTGCGKLYWAGTHHDRMSALIGRVLEPPPSSPR